MKPNLDTCGFIGCSKPAVYRGATIFPPVKISRCEAHYGHHEFTSILENGEWKEWHPADYVPKRTMKGFHIGKKDIHEEDFDCENIFPCKPVSTPITSEE